jgi:hypothetical protein
MKQSQTLKYFQAAFEKWFKKSKLKQYQAAMLLEVSQSLVTQFLRGKTGLSFAQADDIATKLNTTVINMLQEGKQILEPENIEGKNNLTEEQLFAIDAFKVLVGSSDKTAKMIIKNVLECAQDLRTETGDLDPTKKQGLRSA